MFLALKSGVSKGSACSRNRKKGSKQYGTTWLLLAAECCRLLPGEDAQQSVSVCLCVFVPVRPAGPLRSSRCVRSFLIPANVPPAPPSRVRGRWRAAVAPGYLGGSREALPSQTRIRTEISPLTFDLWSFQLRAGIFLLKESRYQVGKEGHLCPNPILLLIRRSPPPPGSQVVAAAPLVPLGNLAAPNLIQSKRNCALLMNGWL